MAALRHCAHMLLSLTYVSRSLLETASADMGVEAIVEVARAHNSEAGITGALIFSGTNFAQTLEGSPEIVRALMARIAADPRHTSIKVISEMPARTREYQNWSMAYNGRTTFVQHHIAAASEASPYADISLRTLMRALSGAALL